MRYPESRLLIDPHAEAFHLHHRGSFCPWITFVTGGVNGKTARDTALGNLADASEYEGALELRGGSTNELIAVAVAGAYKEVDTDG